jgi:hypothetical protein
MNKGNACAKCGQISERKGHYTEDELFEEGMWCRLCALEIQNVPQIPITDSCKWCKQIRRICEKIKAFLLLEKEWKHLKKSVVNVLISVSNKIVTVTY